MNTTADKLQGILDSKAAIKAAIEAKGVSVGDATLAQYASKIGDISGGGEEDYSDDVIFIDYDGKVLHRYTAEEFLALDAMPANPTHSGLTSQGWNWTLADAQGYVEECGMLEIGQMYITDDGKTRLHITLDDENYLSPSISLAANATIDWGDGSATDMVNVATTLTHTYPAVGDYVITIDKFYNIPITPSASNIQYLRALRAVFLGNVNSLGTYFFRYCSGIETITMPNTLASFSSGGIVQYCTSLKALTIPSSITSLGNYTIQYCANIRIISFPKDAVFGNGNLDGDFSLERLSFPIGEQDVKNNTMLYGLRRVTMASGVTSVLNNYQIYLSLYDLHLSDNIVSLPQYYLSRTFSLKDLALPSELQTIAQRALQECYLTKLTIPSKVTDIGQYAFYNSYFIVEVHVKPTTPPTAGTGIFQGCSALSVIYVPQGTLSAYQTASGWSAYASYMQEENE